MNQIHPTTAAVGSSASGVIIIVWIASLLHLDLPADVAVALVGVFGGIVGALMRKMSADVGIVVPVAPLATATIIPAAPVEHAAVVTTDAAPAT